MASVNPKCFIAPTLLHSKTFLPDSIWISPPCHPKVFLDDLREQRDERTKKNKNKSIHFSFSDINDSDFYSIDEITTAGVSSDEQVIQAKKPPLPPRKHVKQNKGSKHRKPHLQKEPVYIPTPNARERPPRHIQAVRSAIERLGDDPSSAKTAKGKTPRALVEEHQTGEPSSSADVLEAKEDSFSHELTTFVRRASIRTKKVLKKFKASDLVTSPKKFWKRGNKKVTERVSSGSLSTADPSASYHLPQDMSPLSNRSPGASSTGDMDIPFSNGLMETRTVDNFSRESERRDGNRALRKKTNSALRYVQKWKSKSRSGRLMLRNRSGNIGEEVEGDESTWNSASREGSLRKRFARSLSF